MIVIVQLQLILEWRAFIQEIIFGNVNLTAHDIVVDAHKSSALCGRALRERFASLVAKKRSKCVLA